MLRLFVAIDLPAALRADVEALCRGVESARWVKVEQLHVTFRFMGNVPDDALPDVRRRLSDVTAAPFDVTLVGPGIFPEARSRKPPRVLWLGLEPRAPLAGLKAEIDRVLGPDPEAPAQGFVPHLTLARFGGRPGESLAAFLRQHHASRSASWTVDAFRLYRSHWSSSGAIHEPIQSYSLVGERSAP